MTSSTLLTTLTAATDTFWQYLTTVLQPLIIFAVSLAVLSLAIYFVLKRIRVIG